MTSLELHMTGHWDALGAALLVALVAVIATCAISIHYDRLVRGHREVYRTRLAAEQAKHRERLDALMPSRRITVEEAAAQAERITRHESRTWLQEALGDLTMEGPPFPINRPIPYRLAESPVWTEGGRD